MSNKCPCGKNLFVRISQKDISCIRCSACGFVTNVHINTDAKDDQRLARKLKQHNRDVNDWSN